MNITVWADAIGAERAKGQVLIGGSGDKGGVTHGVVIHEGGDIQGETGPPCTASPSYSYSPFSFSSCSSSSSSLAVPSGWREGSGGQTAL